MRVSILAGVMQDRSAIAARMRLEGHSYEAIGKALGVSRQRAHQMTADMRVPVRLKLPIPLVTRLRGNYERACKRRGQESTDAGFHAWVSLQLAEALDA
jgi:hypothetical protein